MTNYSFAATSSAISGVRVVSTDRTDRQVSGGSVLADLVSPLLADAGRAFETPWPVDFTNLEDYTSAQILDMLITASPEIAKMRWDFLRMCNSGWNWRVTSENPLRERRAKTAVLEFFARLTENYGAVDIVWNQFFISAFTRGAFFVELVLDLDRRTPIDLVVIDPKVARFRRVVHPKRGKVWQVGYYNSGVWVALDYPTIRFVPIDATPDSPLGGSLITPALFPAAFLLQMLSDIRRVVGQQGYPRIDLVIKLENLLAAMPREYEGDVAKIAEWVEAAIAEVQTVYESLSPDDAYIHTDVVEVHSSGSAFNAQGLGVFDEIIGVVERMMTRGGKTMPLLMGTNDSSTEGSSNRQWEIFLAGIRSVQNLAESVIAYFLELMLRAQGLQATVTINFDELRASEQLRLAQAMQMETVVWKMWYDYGWASQDEAARAMVGHDAVLPAPLSDSNPKLSPQPDLDDSPLPPREEGYDAS